MFDLLTLAGLICLVAAVVGGGLSAQGWQIPLIASRGRQIALAVLGISLLALTYALTLVHQRGVDHASAIASTKGNCSPATSKSTVHDIKIDC